jgi:uncharacterized membrane protein YqjE
MERSSYEGIGVPARDRSFSDVLKDVIGSVQDLIRSEVKLAKAETKEEVVKAWSASRLLISGAVLGLYALGFMLLGGIAALATRMPYWAAALCMGAGLGIIAMALISTGRSRLKHVHPTPERTIQTVKENVEWMKDQTR